MLSGFNANVRHRGVLFHVQTEDSGRAHPHVITHLFHGGNILASEKRSYQDRLGEADLAAQVRRLMAEQHEAMVRKLHAGALDDVIRERLGEGALGPAAARPPEPTPAAARTTGEPAPDRPTAPAAAAAPADATAPPGGPERQPPLDEVVLDYLVEAARRRAKR